MDYTNIFSEYPATVLFSVIEAQIRKKMKGVGAIFSPIYDEIAIIEGNKLSDDDIEELRSFFKVGD